MVERKKLFGTNGIRGVSNKDLTPEKVIKIGSAIGTFFNNAKVIVGYDARTTGPIFAKGIIAGLNSTGCDVLFIGMAPTPSIQYAVKRNRVDGAIIITASHNPPEYNGIKVIWKDGIEISREQEKQIEDIFFSGKIAYSNWNRIGTTQELYGVNEDYVQGVRKHLDIQKIQSKKFKIVVDAGNSVTALTAPTFLGTIGCEVITLNANIDGTFPGRLPEPRPENLQSLATMVKAIGANLGVAFDGDGDRAIFIDEQGEIQWGDKTFTLVAKHFLMNHQGKKIITPVSSSSMIKDIVEIYCGELIWTKVGSVTVSHTMKEQKALLGGEENGGIFYGPHQSVRDGLMATGLILEIMAKTDQTLSALIQELPTYFIVKKKIDCQNTLKKRVMDLLINQLEKLNTTCIDGVKIWFEDNSSILIRPSGTEPIIRLYAEAKNKGQAEKLVQKYTSRMSDLIEKLQ